jgi:hypothetical protein
MTAAAKASTERSDRFIELPARIIFTAAGLDVFQRSGTPVRRVLNREGVAREGLESPRFNASTVQKMVMNGYVEEICAQLPDLLSRRFHVISANNLIVYAILYKKLSPSLARTMFETQVVREFNRKNPKHSIVDLKHINPAAADHLVRTRAELFRRIEQEITEETSLRIERNAGLSAEDRSTMRRSLPKFLDWIDKRIWYLYYIIYQTPQREQIKTVFAGMLAQYLDHTRIATHLSNLLMEFVQNSEKAHFERLIVRSGLAIPDKADAFMRDRENRALLVETAKKSKQWLELSWNMNPERLSVGQAYRIQITVSNFGLIDERVRSSLAKKMKTNVDGISLSDFYRGDADAEKLGAGLGLLYNSYLEDICRREGIQYRCNIFPEPGREKTSVRVEISL